MPPDPRSASHLWRSFSLSFLCVPRRKNHATPLFSSVLKQVLVQKLSVQISLVCEAVNMQVKLICTSKFVNQDWFWKWGKNNLIDYLKSILKIK